jgi:hypothetical protein
MECWFVLLCRVRNRHIGTRFGTRSLSCDELRELLRGTTLRDVVGIDHRRLNVGVTHECLNVHAAKPAPPRYRRYASGRETCNERIDASINFQGKFRKHNKNKADGTLEVTLESGATYLDLDVSGTEPIVTERPIVNFEPEDCHSVQAFHLTHLPH